MDPKELLTISRLPGRTDSSGAAILIGVHCDDIQYLCKKRLLKPLGSIDVSSNATKFFSTLEIQELMNDRKWLGRVTDAIYERHRRRNNSQTQRVNEIEA